MSWVGQAVYRFVAGRPLTTRPGVWPYFHRGDGRWAGWQRQVLRLSLALGGAPVYQAATLYRQAFAVAASVLLVWLRRWWGGRKFHRTYIAPTVKAIRTPLGMIEVDLYVDRRLGSLVARLAKPLSPAEEWARERYGRWLEPVWRRPADQVQRARWAVSRRLATHAAGVVLWFRRPVKNTGPRIEIRAALPYATPEQRSMVSAIIKAKIPVGDMAETWHQVGFPVTAVWVPRARPPGFVGLDALNEHFPNLKEWEFFLGLGAGNKPVIVSLQDDSPHIAESAGSGAGKSVLAQLIAVQVLRRGGNVLILDIKGSHRWALDLPGVDYCTEPDQMHHGFIRAAQLAKERNRSSFREPEGWDPGPRLLVICEELNATVGMLRDYWADVRGKGQPKRSPAIGSLNEIAYMGRGGKVNLLAIAQSLTARAIGGPEARENFGIRCLARYTVNAWKMLVPEAAMPRPSRTLGRWQVVVAGQATETQVCYLTPKQARAFAVPEKRADGLEDALTPDVTDNRNVTLQDAVDDGLFPWSLDAAKMRLSRARRAGQAVPKSVGRKGRADLYRRHDLAAFVEAERVR